MYEGRTCSDCSVLKECTKGKARQIHQDEREILRDQMRARLSEKAGREIYNKRLNMIESRFGHMKFNLKYHIFSLRSLQKVDGEYKVIYLVMNILKMYRKKILQHPFYTIFDIGPNKSAKQKSSSSISLLKIRLHLSS